MTPNENNNRFVGFDTDIETPYINEDENTDENIHENGTDNAGNSENSSQQASTQPNKITVHVNDKTSPILLLFGAPSSGKTMTLVRLAKYLRTKGFTLSVDKNFCTDAWEYPVNTKKFNDMLSTTESRPGTGRNDFLFIKIADGHGKTILQILEGAGEDYFPSIKVPGTDRSRTPFPPYMTGIFTGPNKKIWLFLTEPDWRTYEEKQDYVERIGYCKKQYVSPRDKSIIVYNKVDKTDYVYGPGLVNIPNAMKGCTEEYPGLFDKFKNPSVLPWADKYTFKFVPFSTGVFSESSGNEPQHYDPSSDKYPQALWETIVKCIKG